MTFVTFPILLLSVFVCLITVISALGAVVGIAEAGLSVFRSRLCDTGKRHRRAEYCHEAVAVGRYEVGA